VLSLLFRGALNFVNDPPDFVHGLLCQLFGSPHHMVASFAHELIFAGRHGNGGCKHASQGNCDGTNQKWIFVELALEKTLGARGLNLNLVNDLPARFLHLVDDHTGGTLHLFGYLTDRLLGLVGHTTDGLLTVLNHPAEPGALGERPLRPAGHDHPAAL